MNELDAKNAVWMWLYENGFKVHDPKVFKPIWEEMKRKLEEADDDEGEDSGSLQQILMSSEKMNVKRVVRSTLENTSNKNIERFVENIMMFDLFEGIVFKARKQTKEQNEENDLSDLDIDDLKL